MGIRDIKNASSIKNFGQLLKGLPTSFGKVIYKLFTIKNHEQRMLFLKSLPEETLLKLVKISTYLILSSGVVLKETAFEIYMTPEIKVFLDKIKEEIDKAGELTKETVSMAVDIAIETMNVVAVAGIISLVVFLMLNPPAAATVAGISLFIETALLFYSPPEKPHKK